MRRLHTVAKHEKFVASGLYTCFEQGAASGAKEYWSVHEVGDGAQFIRVDMDGRDYDGHSVLIEALRNPAGQFERIDQHIYERANSKPHKMSYTFFDDHIELVSLVNERRLEDQVTMPPGYGLLSSSWLLTGLTIKQVVEQAGKMTLLRVNVQDDQFNWSRIEVAADPLGLEKLVIDGHELAAPCYRWRQDMTACVDSHGVILRAAIGENNVVLSHYARRPELKSA